MRHLSALAVLALAGLASPVLACPGHSEAAAPVAQPVAMTAEKAAGCGEKAAETTAASKPSCCATKTEAIASACATKPTAVTMRLIAFRGGMLPIAVPAVLSSAAMTTPAAAEPGCCSGKAKGQQVKAETGKSACSEKASEAVAARSN